MTSRIRTSLLALVIVVALAGAYVIVAENGPKGPAGQLPVGVMH